MSIEIERRFLVKNEHWRPHVVRKLRITQGYLANEGNATVRVRVTDDHNATLTIKSHAAATCRHEFEYAIPLADAASLLKLRSGGLLRKVRHIVISNGNTWEVDVFEDENAGLVIAELELETVGQKVDIPDWVDREITGDVRFSNSHLTRQPYVKFAADLSRIGFALAGE
jgi:adenylate cyclase